MEKNSKEKQQLIVLWPYILFALFWTIFSLWVCIKEGEYYWAVLLISLGFIPLIWNIFFSPKSKQTDNIEIENKQNILPIRKKSKQSGNIAVENKQNSSLIRTKSNQPKFIQKKGIQGKTYEIYKGKDAESAKELLKSKKVDKQLYYIVVETPEGNWGLDIKGLYLEQLLSFQKNVNSAKCEGFTCGMPDLFGLEMASKGYNDNFIVRVECGKCKHQWDDGLRYKNITVVRCPKCKTLNKIDTKNLNVTFLNG